MSVGSEAAGPAPAQPAMPSAARWLGAGGVIPFAVLALGSAFGDAALGLRVVPALIAYGAVILSFLGGVHWGLAIAGFGAAGSAAMWPHLGLSVVPSLVGWAALLVPTSAGLPVLAAAFAAMLVIDLRATRRGAAPAWYPLLRWPLTAAVVAALVIAALV